MIYNLLFDIGSIAGRETLKADVSSPSPSKSFRFHFFCIDLKGVRGG